MISARCASLLPPLAGEGWDGGGFTRGAGRSGIPLKAPAPTRHATRADLPRDAGEVIDACLLPPLAGHCALYGWKVGMGALSARRWMKRYPAQSPCPHPARDACRPPPRCGGGDLVARFGCSRRECNDARAGRLSPSPACGGRLGWGCFSRRIGRSGIPLKSPAPTRHATRVDLPRDAGEVIWLRDACRSPSRCGEVAESRDRAPPPRCGRGGLPVRRLVVGPCGSGRRRRRWRSC